MKYIEQFERFHLEHANKDSKSFEGYQIAYERIFQYESDNSRLYSLREALLKGVTDEQVVMSMLTDTWDGYDDLSFVADRGDYIDYYEGFVQSCWDGVYIKQEYKGLSKSDAVEKMVDERFSKIAAHLNLKIKSWSFKKSVLHIVFASE
jgi:hypothetical protein